MTERWVRRRARAVLRYYAALRLAAGSMLDIVPAGVVAEIPPVVRRSANELPSGFDRRELVEVRGLTHVITLAPRDDRRASGFGLN